MKHFLNLFVGIAALISIVYYGYKHFRENEKMNKLKASIAVAIGFSILMFLMYLWFVK